MKKILALTIAILMVASMFAACGNENANTEAQTTEPQVTTEPQATEPQATEPETTEPNEKYVVIEKLSKHENGWNQDAWGNGSHGVFFNAFANDLPYNNDDGYVYYRPLTEDAIKLVRDGETIELGNPFIDFLNKADRTAYYLRFEEWMIDEYFPIVNGDMIIVDGDFYNADNGYTVHIGPVYMTFAGDMVKFHTSDPTAN